MCVCVCVCVCVCNNNMKTVAFKYSDLWLPIHNAKWAALALCRGRKLILQGQFTAVVVSLNTMVAHVGHFSSINDKFWFVRLLAHLQMTMTKFRKTDSHLGKARRRRLQPAVVTVCLFVGCLTPRQHASVSQGRICSHNFYVLPRLRQKLQIKFLTSPSHGILTPGRPVPALTL